MKEICHEINLIHISDVVAVTGNNITLASGAQIDKVYADNPAFDPGSGTSDAGIAFSLNQSIVIEKVSDALAGRYSYQRHCVLIIKYTDGTHTIYGTPGYPVLTHILRGLQRDTLILALSTTVPPAL